MSLDATNWAWRVRQKQKKGGSLKPLKKLVLLSLADRAGEDHCAYPSMSRLVEDTEMDRKTVLKIIDELIEDGIIVDTGERKGRTKQVKVYRLLGVTGRETVPVLAHFNAENDQLKSPNNGTVPTMEQSQQSAERVPTIPLKGTNVGTRNLLKNLSMNLSCEHEWIPEQNQLISVLKQAGQERNLKLILELPSFEFELGSFNSHHSGRVLGDGKKLYSFGTWIIDKFEQYVRRHPEYLNPTEQPAQNQNTAPISIDLLSVKPKGFLGGAQ